MSYHTKLDEKLEGDDKFWAWKYRIYLVLEENELDSYIHEEIPVPKGDEAKGITPEELGQGLEDHCLFNQGSPCTTSVSPKDTKEVWFLDQAIWREEHKSEYEFEKQLKNFKI